MQELAITSDEALVLEQLPGQTVAIVGAGRVAMEFATIFRGLGADVHIICRRKAPLPRCCSRLLGTWVQQQILSG